MIKKCLFPAAGYGTRFLPATKAMPKEMLPVVNKPLIQYGVEEALEAGLNQISIVTGRGKRALEDHFDISYELENQIKGTDKEKYLVGIRKLLDECSFSYTRQTEMKGLGHAILTGRPLIGDEPFAVVLADDLCVNLEGDGVLTQMVKVALVRRLLFLWRWGGQGGDGIQHIDAGLFVVMLLQQRLRLLNHGGCLCCFDQAGCSQRRRRICTFEQHRQSGKCQSGLSLGQLELSEQNTRPGGIGGGLDGCVEQLQSFGHIALLYGFTGLLALVMRQAHLEIGFARLF